MISPRRSPKLTGRLIGRAPAVLAAAVALVIRAPAAEVELNAPSTAWRAESTRGALAQAEGGSLLLQSPSETEGASVGRPISVKPMARYRITGQVRGAVIPASRGRGLVWGVALDGGPRFLFPIRQALTNGSAPIRAEFRFETFRDSKSNAQFIVRLAGRGGQVRMSELKLEELGGAADPDPDFSEMGKIGGRAAALRHTWALLLDASRRIDLPLFKKLHASLAQRGEALLATQEKNGAFPSGLGENLRLLAILGALPETAAPRREAFTEGARRGLVYLVSNQEPSGRLFRRSAAQTMDLAQASLEAFVWIEAGLDESTRARFAAAFARAAHFSRECYAMDRGSEAFGEALASSYPALDASYAAFLSVAGKLLGREAWMRDGLAQYLEMCRACQRPSGAFDAVSGLPQVPALQEQTVLWSMRLLAVTKDAGVQKALMAAAGWVEAYAYPCGLSESGLTRILPGERFAASMAAPAAFLASLGDGRWRQRFDERLAGEQVLGVEDADVLFWIPSIKEREAIPSRFFEPNPDTGGLLFRRDGLTIHLTGSDAPTPTLLTAVHVDWPNGPWRGMLKGIFAESAPSASEARGLLERPALPTVRHRQAALEGRLMAQHSRGELVAAPEGHALPPEFGSGAWDPGPAFRGVVGSFSVAQTWMASGGLFLGQVEFICRDEAAGSGPRLRLPMELRERILEATNAGADGFYRFGTLGLALLDAQGAWKVELSPGAYGDAFRLRLPPGDYIVRAQCGDPSRAIPSPGMRISSGGVSSRPLICAMGGFTNATLAVRHPGGEMEILITAGGLHAWACRSLWVGQSNGKETRFFEAGPPGTTAVPGRLRFTGEAFDASRGWGWSRDLSSALVARSTTNQREGVWLLTAHNLPVELALVGAAKTWKRGERLRVGIALGLAGEGDAFRRSVASVRRGRLATGVSWMGAPDGGAFHLALWNEGSLPADFSLPLPPFPGPRRAAWASSDGTAGEIPALGERMEGRIEGDGVQVVRVGGR